MSDSQPDHKWRLTREALADVCRADSWLEAYRRIIRHSPLFQDGADRLIDKTPAYVRQLPAILDKVPGIPCIVAVKSLPMQYHSYKRRRWSLKHFRRHYLVAQRSLAKAIRRHGQRIIVVHQQDLVARPEEELARAYRAIGLEFPEDREFKTRVWQRHRRRATAPVHSAEYDFKTAQQQAEAELTPAERRVLASLPDLVRPAA